MTLDQEVHSVVERYFREQGADALTELVKRVAGSLSPEAREQLLNGATPEAEAYKSQLREARIDYADALIKTEEELTWIIGETSAEGDSNKKTEMVRVPYCQTGETHHFLIDRGTEGERFDFVDKVRLQAKVFRTYTRRIILAEPEDFNLQIARTYMHYVKVKGMVTLAGNDITNLHELRCKMLRDDVMGISKKNPPRYTFLFIFDYDKVVEGADSDALQKFRELVNDGAKYGINIIASTGGDPYAVEGDGWNTIILPNDHESAGDDTAFVNIDGEMRMVDIF